MFTGLIRALCTIDSIRQNADSMHLVIDLADLAAQSKIGDSVSINGICLTISHLDSRRAAFDVSPETIAKSALAKLKPSSKVNVELAMKPGDRFGGHFVLGHIDAIATIKAIEKSGSFAAIKFAAPPELLSNIVKKGSIAVDGISLTVADIDKSTFTVALIPQTLQNTTLASAKIGDAVNIETDIIVKAVNKQLEILLPTQQKLTMEKLKQLGF